MRMAAMASGSREGADTAGRCRFHRGQRTVRCRSNHGPQPSRTMNVRRAIPDDAPAIAKVHVDAQRTTYAGILPAVHLVVLSHQDREQIWRNNLSGSGSREFTFVVESDEAEIIAFAAGVPVRDGDRIYRGELRAIYIIQRLQRQGHGRRLTGAV